MGSLDGERTCHIISQLAKAIEAFHLHGVIHRDIKPGNIILQPTGLIKVIDQDVSKICMEHQGRIFLKSFFRKTCNEFKDKERIGTEAYMAPESHTGKPFGRSVDWWAMGVTLFKLLTGENLDSNRWDSLSRKANSLYCYRFKYHFCTREGTFSW